MGIFTIPLPSNDKKIKKILEKGEYEKLTISQIIRNVDHCGACNWGSIQEDEKAGKKEVWLNPSSPQHCFNYGTFEHQDFVDWANGTGKIIKGKTQEQKDKFMKYARAYNDEKIGWEAIYGARFAHLFDDHVKYLQAAAASIHGKTDIIDKNLHQEEIIKQIFGDKILRLKEEMTYRDYTQVRNEWREESYGITKTLALLGIGSFGYSNTPEELWNLAWVADTAFKVAKYLYLMENGYADQMPDVEFVEKNRYKNS